MADKSYTYEELIKADRTIKAIKSIIRCIGENNNLRNDLKFLHIFPGCNVLTISDPSVIQFNLNLHEDLPAYMKGELARDASCIDKKWFTEMFEKYIKNNTNRLLQEFCEHLESELPKLKESAINNTADKLKKLKEL